MTTLFDCRVLPSISWTVRDEGRELTVVAHDGRKPSKGDLLALRHPRGGAALYRCVEVDHCYNVDPANMWIARVEFVPASERIKIDPPDLPEPPLRGRDNVVAKW